jgi:hypothetical protein
MPSALPVAASLFVNLCDRSKSTGFNAGKSSKDVGCGLCLRKTG